ncbi:MAG TPA: hypothetical protein VGM87_19635, partial [Roseomonas sp.]
IDLYGDGLMSLEITGPVRQAPADGGALVTNTGTLQADGGRIALTAAAADGIVQNLVRAGGRISANTDAATGRRGEVVVAGTGGAVVIEGQVEARGVAAGQRGGTVEVVADRVLAAAGARIDASGSAGGGEIAFGQTRQGSAMPRRAQRTGVAAGAELRADATVLGQGGRVVLHSTDTTLMGGTVSARGGPRGGDGGFVEVSGERGFQVPGTVDASAPAGRPGQVLYDPDTLRIVADGTPGLLTDADVADGILAGDNPPGLALISPGQIVAVTGDLVLQATNSISVEAAVTKGSGSLTLQTTGAAGSITLGADLILGNGLTASGNLTLIAGTGGIAQTAGRIFADTLSVQSGGDVTLTGANNAIGTLTTSNVTGNFTLGTTGLPLLFAVGQGPVTLAGNIVVSGIFDVTARGTTLLQDAAGIITTPRLNAAADGDINLPGANQVQVLGPVTAGGETIFIVNARALTVAGPVRSTGEADGNIGLEVHNGDLVVDGTLSIAGTGLLSGIDLLVVGGDLIVNGRIDAIPEGGGQGVFALAATGNVTIGAGAVVRGNMLGENFDRIVAGRIPDQFPPYVHDQDLPVGITLAGTVESAGDAWLFLAAGTGGIRQTGGSVTAGGLFTESGADVRLDAAPNAVAGLITFNGAGIQVPGDFVLDNGTTPLTLAGQLQAANIGIITTGTFTLAPPGSLAIGNPGFLTAAGGRVSLRIGDLAIPDGITAIPGPRITGAIVEIAPAAAGTPMQVALPDAAPAPPAGTFTLRNALLAQIEVTDTFRFGATTFAGVTTTTAGDLQVAGNFDFAGAPGNEIGTLDLRGLGAVTQAAGTTLGADILSGAAGGALTVANAGNSLLYIGDMTAGGGIAVNSDGQIFLRGLVASPGQLVSLTTSGMIDIAADIAGAGERRIIAGELRVRTSDGGVTLTGANAIERLGESFSGGDMTLVNAGPLLTVPAGALVDISGTGSITATSGSITVDGTVQAQALTLTASNGTVAVNGFSAIASAGALALSARQVAVDGLIAGSTGITVDASQGATLAGIARTPDLRITTPAAVFGGLDATAARVRLLLGGSASGAIDAGTLEVADGGGALLTGTIAGIAGGPAAARGTRSAGGLTLGDPPANQFDFLFNDCPLAASVCARPPQPEVPGPDPSQPEMPGPDPSQPVAPPFEVPGRIVLGIPTYTVADNPAGVVGEVDPAGQPPANPLVTIPVLPLDSRPGRDTTEDRELAPPDVRAQDF